MARSQVSTLAQQGGAGDPSTNIDEPTASTPLPDITPAKILEHFELRKSYYKPREDLTQLRLEYFEGYHWPEAPKDDNGNAISEHDYELVFNYTRHTVLSYVATFARSPMPVVPMPQDPTSRAKANNRERLLTCLWDELAEAWYDVELNASKLGCGVFQALWAPDSKEAEAGVFKSVPFIFRSIPINNFFPIFRSRSKPNDFLEVFRYDPGRSVVDLEEKYNIDIAATATSELGDEAHFLGCEPSCDVVEWWTGKNYALIAIATLKMSIGKSRKTKFVRSPIWLQAPQAHGLSRIPFWILQNMRTNPDVDVFYGSLGDMDDIVELNQHLDHIVSEAAEEIVLAIHRPIIYQSSDHVQTATSLKLTPGAVWPIGNKDDEDVHVLEYGGTQSLVQQHIEQVYKGLQDMSFMGAAGFGELPSGTSGIAARIALTPFQQIIELKLPQRKRTLKSICEHVLRELEVHMRLIDIELQVKATEQQAATAPRATFIGWIQQQYHRYGEVQATADDIDGTYYVDIDFGNLMPRDEIAYQQNEIYKFSAGSQSLIDTASNCGVADAEAYVQRIKDEFKDPELFPEKVQASLELKQLQMSLAAPVAGATPPMGGGGGAGAGGGTPPVTGSGVEGPAGASMSYQQQQGQQAGPPSATGRATPTAPQVPTEAAAPRSMGDGDNGPGRLAPTLNRKGKGR